LGIKSEKSASKPPVTATVYGTVTSMQRILRCSSSHEQSGSFPPPRDVTVYTRTSYTHTLPFLPHQKRDGGPLQSPLRLSSPEEKWRSLILCECNLYP